MIIFDLICTDGAHQFEGWFGSSDDYEKQKSAGMIACPFCASANIKKALMAPNVGVKSNQSRSATPSANEISSLQGAAARSKNLESTAVKIPAEYKELLGKLAKAQTEILQKSEWVGDNFSDEARAIHYGDSEEKPIHGTASPDDVIDMEEEGIELTPLPFPVSPPESQN